MRSSGLVVGFAARQTLANLVAGILIAVTQPIRIGDTVTIGEDSGRVDDLTLSYTYIDPGDGRLMVVPNERVVTSVLFNHSTGDRTAPATVSVWVPPAADLEQARGVLKPAGAAEVSVAEMTPEGVRIELKGPRDHERTQVGDEEARLRESAHEALRRRASSISHSAGSRGRPSYPFRPHRMTQRGRKGTVARGGPSAQAPGRVRRPARRHASRGGVGIWVLSVRADTPPLDQLKPVREGSNSVVYAADGSRLGYIQSDTIRHPVAASRIPKVLERATVAIEDEHYYEHSGIDYGAIMRAGWEDLKAGEAVQGGSTITQQLVRTCTSPTPRRRSRERFASRPGQGVRAEVLEAASSPST